MRYRELPAEGCGFVDSGREHRVVAIRRAVTQAVASTLTPPTAAAPVVLNNVITARTGASTRTTATAALNSRIAACRV
jgi:hypothetical protein